jgi:hypothetical protein
MRLFLLGGLAVASAAAAASNCSSRDVRTVVAGQGFTGALEDGGDTLTRLGSWGGAGSIYSVYWYEHVDRTRRAGHGVRSVIVIDGNCSYLGRYIVDATQPRLRGREIYFADVPASEGNRIALNSNGPPENVWIDGENLKLAK